MLLAQALAETGCHVAVVAYETENRLPERVGGVDVITRPRYQAGGRRAIGKLSEAMAIWRALWGVDCDVVVKRAAGIEVGLVALLSRLRRRRFVYSSANVVDFEVGSLLTSRRDAALFKLGIRLSNTIVVQTQEQVDLCRRSFNREPVLIKSIAEIGPSETDEMRAPSGRSGCDSQAQPTFLWVGRLVDYKRPELFIELARRVPDAHFKLIGATVAGHSPSFDLLTALQEQAQDLDNLEILDSMPRSEVQAHIKNAVATVNTAEYEGLSNVALESWVCGVPTLALFHDPDGIIERLGLGAFANGSVERLAEMAVRFVMRPEERDRCGEAARAYVRVEHAGAAVALRWRQVLDS